MALRDQPYLPLYVQDFMTDEKLAECSASATGVFVRIMCLMHKSDPYGKILLKQKYKQSTEQVLNFASQVAKNLPYTREEVYAALQELLAEKVMHIEDEFLVQKRMVHDNEVSVNRSKSGRKGGESTQKKVKEIALAKDEAKTQANSENEIEYENEIEDVIVFGKKKESRVSVKKVYAGDSVKIVYDLAAYFDDMAQLEEITRAGWTQFDDFMAANPAGVFDDDRHLYNAFRKFCTNTTKKSQHVKMDDL
jgi:hypothetical protein